MNHKEIRRIETGTGGVHNITCEGIFQIAMEQSAMDINCKADDFLQSNHVVTKYELKQSAKKYYKEPYHAFWVRSLIN